MLLKCVLLYVWLQIGWCCVALEQILIDRVSDRSVLKQAEGNESVKYLIQTFTGCFVRELALLQHQVGLNFLRKGPEV